MIFVRLKIEYFFLFLGFFCFVHRLFTENSSVAICGYVFVSYSLISKDLTDSKLLYNDSLVFSPNKSAFILALVLLILDWEVTKICAISFVVKFNRVNIATCSWKSVRLLCLYFL